MDFHLATGTVSVSRRVTGCAADFAGGLAARARGDVERIHYVGVRFSHAAGRGHRRCGLWVLAAALVAVVDWAEAFPGGHFWARAALWWIVGFYFGLMAVMLWGQRLVSVRWQFGLAATWIVIGLIPPLVRHFAPNDELRCTFVAMGHGTCVVMETSDGQTLLYDAGSLGSPEFATDAVAGYLWDRGILRIDGLILSHADVDHYNAVAGCSTVV